MKNSIQFLSTILIMIIMSSFVTSCSDDDDPTGGCDKALVGAWSKDFNMYYGRCTTTYTFNKNGTGNLSSGEDSGYGYPIQVTRNFKWTANGTIVTINYTSGEHSGSNETLYYVVNGNSVSFWFMSGVEYYTFYKK